MADTLIQLQGVKTYFPHAKTALGRVRSWIKAVDNLDLDIYRGQNLGLVGESGCGKSTLGRTILRLAPLLEGKIIFDGREIQHLAGRALQPYRPKMQMVFQQPQSSLNPKMTVLQILTEALRICGNGRERSYLDRAAHLLELVDLRPEHLFRYPHEYSGGQQQRICIARALATEPQFIIFDEATSALDVSVQAQILNLMNRLQRKLNLTYLFISHDLSVLEQVCHRIAVMYAGHIMEIRRADDLFTSPRHPYTKMLRDSVPIADPTMKQTLVSIAGEPPNLSNPPNGCRFHPRCPYAVKLCSQELPGVSSLSRSEEVHCHRQSELFDNRMLI